MPAFFTSAHLKLSILLSFLGALVALTFSIFSDSGIIAIIFRPIVSALLMFVLGSILFALLEKKVPEAIQAIEAKIGEEPMPDIPPDETGVSTSDTSGEHALDGEGLRSHQGLDSYDSAADVGSTISSTIPRKSGVQVTKDEIVVNGVRFKNEPEVMAETIKQLMDDDKE